MPKPTANNTSETIDAADINNGYDYTEEVETALTDHVANSAVHGGGGQQTQNVISALTSNGVVDIDWSAGDHHKIDAAGYSITGLTESGGPSAGSIQSGTLMVVNSAGTDITVDATALTHGLTVTVTIVAGADEVFQIWSTVQ